MKPMKKMYCNYKFCNCPNRALPKISADSNYKNWKRQFNKKCYFDWGDYRYDPNYKIVNPLN